MIVSVLRDCRTTSPCCDGTGERALEPLLAALAPEQTRSIEGRLAAGFAYAPFDQSVNRALNERTLSTALRLAIATIEQRARQRKDDADEILLAIAALTSGDAHRAVRLLEDAAAKRPADGRVQGDLSCAYLARSRAHRQPEDLVKALAAADRAMRAGHDTVEARFNRALALEGLHLTDAAIAAWREYLAIDPSSPWREEAMRHLAVLRDTKPHSPALLSSEAVARGITRGDLATVQRAVKEDVRAVRTSIRDLVDVWAESCVTRNHCPNDNVLAHAAATAASLHAATSDRLDLDWIETILARHGVARRQLAKAWHEHRRGLALYEAFRFEEAGVCFAAARTALTALRGDAAAAKLAAEPMLEQAAVRYHAQDFVATRPLLDRVVAIARDHDYRRLAARAELILGHIDVNTGHFSEGLDRYERATAVFMDSDDFDGVVNARISAAQTLSLLGQTSESWIRYTDALTSMPRIRTARIRGALLDAAGLAATEAGLPEAARYFVEAAARAAEREGVGAAAAEAHLRLAQVFGQIGDDRRAHESIARARAWNTKAGRMNADYNDARIAAAEGALLGASGSATATALLGRAIDFYERTQQRAELPPVLLARGRAWVRAGRPDLAAQDFERGLATVETLTRSLRQTDLGVSYVDTLFNLVDESVRLYVDYWRQPDRAFAVAERWRGRALWLARDRGQPVPRPLAPGDVARALPANGALLFYYVLPDRLLTWVVTAAGTAFRVSPLDTGALALEVGRLIQGLQARTDVDRSSTALYDWLLRGHAAELRTVRTLYIAPDARLAGLPFSALKDRDTQRLVAETYAIAIVPSVNLFAQLPMAATTHAASGLDLMALSVKDTMDVTGRPLPALPFAEHEVRRIARAYRSPTILTGPASTKSAFLAGLARHDVVHFAGHAVVNPEQPGLSRLLVSNVSAGAKPDAVYPGDIVCPSRCRARLVVLASCESAVGRPSPSEGAMSLARPFVAAGVSAVVATLWPIEDRSASDLFARLHNGLVQGLPVQDALRAAQSAAIAEGGNSDGQWAAVAVVLGRRIE